MKRLDDVESKVENMMIGKTEEYKTIDVETDNTYIAGVLWLAIANLLYLIANINLPLLYATLCKIPFEYCTGVLHYDFSSIERQFLYSKQLYNSKHDKLATMYCCGKDETITKYKACVYALFKKINNQYLIEIENADETTVKELESIYSLLTDVIDEFGFKISNFMKNGKEFIEIPAEKFNDIFFRILFKKMSKAELITNKELQELLEE